MRTVRTVLLTGLCLAGLGCSVDSLFRRLPPEGPPPEQSVGPVTAANLVDYLNGHARDLQALQCNGLSVEANANGQPGTVQGYLVCRQPRDFRMVGKAFGAEEVDIGSNPEEFWFWIKRAEPHPHVYYCKYADLKAGVRLPFPFQPDYIAEALGMATYGPPSEYQLLRRGDTVELVQNVTTPQGQPARKVTVFAYYRQTGTAPQIREYRLEYPNGKLICSARILEVRRQKPYRDSETDVWYPSKVVLTCPDEKLEIRLSLKDVTVNPAIDPQRAEMLFSRRSLTAFPSVDLARGPDARPGGDVRAIRGAMR
jgi:hypothetical protein